MHKLLAALVIVFLALTVVNLPTPVAQAQGGELQFDQPVQGTISDSSYEQTYTFQGTAGQLILIAMDAVEDDYELDPALLLNDASGNRLSENDDFGSGFNAMIAYALTEDGTYTVIATRSGGSTGSGGGDFTLTLSEAELFQPGSTVEAVINSNYELAKPNIYFIKPNADGTWALSFNQPGGDLYASISLVTTDSEEGEIHVLDIEGTGGVRSGTMNVDLIANQIYILTVEQSWYSYSWDEMEVTVTLTLNEAAQ